MITARPAIHSNFFQHLVDKAPVGICTLNMKGYITYANPRLCRLFDTSPEEILRCHFLKFYSSTTNTGYLYWVNLFEAGQLPGFTGWIDLQVGGHIIECRINMELVEAQSEEEEPYYHVILTHVSEDLMKQQQIYEDRVKVQQNIAAAIIQTQENERKFLASELHDNINQLLATTKLYIDSTIESEKCCSLDLLHKSSSNLEKVIVELRTLSHFLTPPALNDLGLATSLQEMVAEFRLLNLFAIDLDIYGLDESALNEDMKLVVYRIIQEQVNNILKHADASHVLIKVRQQGVFLNILVKDNGRGFDPDKIVQGIGLRNIRGRTALFNGTMKIDATPGKGCILSVSFQVN